MAETFSELSTLMTLDNKGFLKSLDQAKGEVQSFSSSSVQAFAKIGLAAAGLASGGMSLLLKSLANNAEMVSQLYDKTQSLGIGIDKFQELSFASDKAGVSADSLNTLLAKMGKTIGNAAAGSQEASDALSGLNLSTKDLLGLSPDQQFLKIADSIKQIGDKNLQASVAVKIFGRNATEALGLFNSDIRSAIDRAKELGITLTEEQGARLDKFDEQIKELSATWHSFWMQFSASAAPFIMGFLDQLQEVVKQWGGMEVVAQKTASVFETAVEGMVAVVKTLNSTIDLGVKGFINLQGYMASNELTNLQDPNSQASMDLSPDARKARIIQLEHIINEKYTAANTNLDDAGKGFVKRSQPISFSSDIAKAAESQIKIDNVTHSLVDLGDKADVAKKALKALADESDRQTKLKEMLRNDFRDTSKPELENSSDFNEIARSIIDESLKNPLQAQQSTKGLFDLLTTTSLLDSIKFGNNRELIDFDTSKQDKQIEDLKKLVMGDKLGKNEIDVHIQASPEFDAKITRISKNSWTDAINAEAMAVNR